MIAISTATFSSTSFTVDRAIALDGPEWLRSVRRAAAEQLVATEFPSESQEIWRYSRISDLVLDDYASNVPSSSDESSAVVTGVESAVGATSVFVETRDGLISRLDIDDALLAKGLVVQRASESQDGDGFATTAEAADFFGYLNLAFSADPLLIQVPAGVVVEAPIVIVHSVNSAGAAVFPRVIVRMGENSEATVCEYICSSDVRALVVPVAELDVAPAANLSYVNVQTLGAGVWQIGYQSSRVDTDANFRSTSVALGGDYARLRTDSALVGKGASSKLGAVYFGSGSQMHDFRTLQNHQAPKTTSDLLFKGAVGEVARSVYSGLIRVKKGAAGTNAFQTNRNLVLSDGAHADSVPNLEIEESDVKCSHASAVGPVDEDQRYYLESRGVPADVAERLIVLGFLDELLASMPIAGLRPMLGEAVSAKLRQLEEAASE